MQQRIHAGRFLCFSVLVSLVFLPTLVWAGPAIRTMDNPNRLLFSGFSSALAALGDNTPDNVVGSYNQAWDDNDHQGRGFVFNGKDGSLLMTLHDPVSRPYAGFGWMVSATADTNADEIPEILVVAPFQTVDEYHVQGEVFLYNGRDGRHLTAFDNPYPHQGSMFGYTFASPGDINDDQIPEPLVRRASILWTNQLRAAYICLSPTGRVTIEN